MNIIGYVILFYLLFLIVNPMPLPSMAGEDYSDKLDSFDIIQDEGLFEGDLQLPINMILAYYNYSESQRDNLIKKFSKNDTANTLKHEAAIDGSIFRLWPNRIVDYDFDASFSMERRMEIRRAMDHWEQHTCVRFVPRREEHYEYLHFAQSDDNSCFTTSIGLSGSGLNIIFLLPRCHFGFVVHEIGHVLGFWHEQSRPDRDDYITVQYQNIVGGENNNNFLKINDFLVDYQGSPYDYKSVMHYPTTWSKKDGCKGSGCITLSVNNPAEYRRQGSPKLGDLRRGLSSEDIKQTNRLYQCPTRGVLGFLAILIKRGVTLQDTDGIWNDPDPYVVIRAVDFNGEEHSQRTSYKLNTNEPVWNELLLFGTNDWQFFRMNVWDEDFGSNEVMSMSQTFPIKDGWHQDIKHCEFIDCSGYVTFDYSFDPRVPAHANLKVYVSSARNLNEPKSWWNRLDPYVVIEAVKYNGLIQMQTTSTVYDSINPIWDQWVEFGCTRWNSFFIQLKDENIGIDSILSDREWVLVYNGMYSNKRHNAYKNGYLTYHYSLRVDANDCEPNPCQHGSECRDGCNNYTCVCARGYLGTKCQHFAGVLRVAVFYGRNLSLLRNRQNAVNAYMKLIAVDVYGHSTEKETKYIPNNGNPNWNELVVFDSNAWRYLKVQIYDRKEGRDQALSDQETIKLPNNGIIRNFRHRSSGTGYAIFEYNYNL